MAARLSAGAGFGIFSAMRPSSPKAEDPGGGREEAELHEAALSYLARFSASRARLALILARRLERARRRQGVEEGKERAERERALIERVIGRLAAAGLIDDEAYAAARSRRLLARGQSPRRIAADLRKRGVSREILASLLPRTVAEETEAALAYLARRRLGPFLPEGAEAPPEAALRALARAGFSAQTARTVLAMSQEEAMARLGEARRSRSR